MTDDEIRDFVIGYCDGRIFTSDDVRDPNMISAVFTVLAFAVPEFISDLHALGAALIWADKRDEGGLCIDGMPSFPPTAPVHVMVAADRDRVRALVGAERVRRQTISVEV